MRARRFRPRLVLLFGVLLIAAPLTGYTFTGEGHISVVAPAHRSLKVVVDGIAIADVPRGGAARLPISHGAHTVTAGTSTWPVEVSRGSDVVLPSGKQCFVVFDVTNLLYWLRGAREPKAVWDNPVRERHFELEPFQLAEDTFLNLDELPRSMEYAGRANLLTEVPCAMADEGDEALAELAPR